MHSAHYWVRRTRKGGTPYNGLNWEAPPEGGIFFRIQVYQMVGISLVEEFESVGKMCHCGL